eukprot:gene6280-12720_t
MSTWFEELFGFKENDLDYESIQFQFQIDKDERNLLRLTSLVNSASYHIGSFTRPTVAEIRDEAIRIGKIGNVRLHHITTPDEGVFGMHTSKKFAGSLFQAASQFNCLEFTSSTGVPENGVTCYMYDPTQGPACAIAAGPATVYRNYLVECNGVNGQSTHSQFNNLETVETILDNVNQKYFQIQNGYTMANKSSVERLNKTLLNNPELSAHVQDNVRIGLHSNVEVPFSCKYRRYEHSSEKDKQIVSQAYCSALSCGYSNIPLSTWEPFACIILNAAYEATLWAGVANYAKEGSSGVLLTFLGGGVFGNKLEWIMDAMLGAICRVSEATKDLDVYIVHYGSINNEVVDYLQDRMLPSVIQIPIPVAVREPAPRQPPVWSEQLSSTFLVSVLVINSVRAAVKSTTYGGR